MKVISNIPIETDEKIGEQISNDVLLRRIQKKEEPLQLDLGLKESPLNRLFEARQKLDRLEDRLKASNFWKNPFLWMILFFPIVMLGFFLYIYFVNKNSIPSQVPILWLNSEDISTIFMPHYWLIVISVIPVGVSLLSLILLKFHYPKLERYVVIFMLMIFLLTIISYEVVFHTIKLVL